MALSVNQTSFATPLGQMSLSWQDNQICGMRLLGQTKAADNSRAVMAVEDAPRFVQKLAGRIARHCAGQADAFADVALQFGDKTEFAQTVYATARRIPVGKVTTYAALAAASGRSGAARAVGSLMAKNPIPLLMPCHRVVGADGSLSGYSAEGGLTTKLRLLTVEGFDLTQLHRSGSKHLNNADPKLAQAMRGLPRFALHAQTRDPFTHLARAIVQQQLSVAAGGTIWRRVVDALGQPSKGGAERLRPQRILQADVAQLRALGISQAKATYVRALAEFSSTGGLAPESLVRLDDDTIIDRLQVVPGLGVWTIQMFLLFGLGRLNVLPVGDLGVRRAVMLLYGLKDLPDAQTLTKIAKPWHPFCSIASWYLWAWLEKNRQQST